MVGKKILQLVFMCSLFSGIAAAQDTVSSDGLFQAARKAAFDNKDYNTAKHYCYKALEKSPGYADIRIFLGRLYTWTDQYDSAKACFETVLKNSPDYEDAAIAFTDLEYWNDHYDHALAVCNAGLQHHPSSKELITRQAKVLIAARRYPEAHSSINQLLAIDPSNTEARVLADRIKDVYAKNKLGISYDYTYFDKQFDAPWHLVALDYTRSTSLGSVTGRINYANRFKENGVQYEVDAYPRISKTFYSYVNLGYSGSDGLFPKFRAGFSLYANLPKSFEAEAGLRYLHFSTDTWIYTLYLGKYYKNWLFNARVYLTPDNSTISQSYSLGARYYYKGTADDYVWFTAGTGISPDQRSSDLLLNSNYKLLSKKANVTWRFTAGKYNSIILSAGWVNTEYLKDTRGNQYELGIGYIRSF